MSPSAHLSSCSRRPTGRRRPSFGRCQGWSARGRAPSPRGLPSGGDFRIGSWVDRDPSGGDATRPARRSAPAPSFRFRGAARTTAEASPVKASRRRPTGVRRCASLVGRSLPRPSASGPRPVPSTGCSSSSFPERSTSSFGFGLDGGAEAVAASTEVFRPWSGVQKDGIWSGRRWRTWRLWPQGTLSARRLCLGASSFTNSWQWEGFPRGKLMWCRQWLLVCGIIGAYHPGGLALASHFCMDGSWV
mmetsp:Transcript_62328/g.184437  ORF Transcript_62328/g.184437 Transcript_62328/m.184437 type:complete len:246 (+) Transcript_62328:509-1246(+)